LVIRDQTFSPPQFLAAVALFGEPREQVYPQYEVPGCPLVHEVSNHHRDKAGVQVKHGPRWHTDHTNHVYPPKYTSLYAVELPDRGGATSVVNMRAGYDALPEAIKHRIDGMQTANVYVGSAAPAANGTAAEAQRELDPVPVLQPLVRTNPDSGSKALYFNPNKTENIVGMGPEESQALLDDLVGRAVRPEYIYEHAWRPGDMLIWDNRSAMHKAGFDYDQSQHRLLYRALVKGELPH
jgi:taurine dioxygenase